MTGTKLSVNINKVALIRNSRGGNLPDVLQIARDCEQFGAQGITVHPRPDERHIRYADVEALKAIVRTELNVEGNPRHARFMALIAAVKPDQCTLVPDAEDALTSSSGWDTVAHADYLREVIAEIQSYGTRVSVFVNPDGRQVAGAKAVGADRIEFYTGDYAQMFAVAGGEQAIRPCAQAAAVANEIGIGINAGHDLNLANLPFFCRHIPQLLEVSIGHALISDALYYGLQNTIQLYLRCLRGQ